MKNLNALAISISVLGALATFLALGPLGGVYLIWAAFVAWGRLLSAPIAPRIDSETTIHPGQPRGV